MALSAGLGALGSYGVKPEVVENTPENPATMTYIPILSEGMSANRASVPSNSLVGARMTTNVGLGIQTATGGFSMEVDGSNTLLPMWLWNGDTGYTFSVVGGYAVAVPTGVPIAGGVIPNGTYIYAVSTVLQRTVDLRLVHMPKSANSAGVVYGGGNNQGTITWTNVTAPAGYTHVGTIIWRTLVGGVVLYFDKYVAGTGNSTTDNQLAVDQTVVPYTVIPNQHQFKGVIALSNTEPIPAFSVVVNKNNDNAEEYVGCRMNDMNINMSDPNGAITTEFSIIARNVVPVANQTPSFTVLEPFIGWTAKAYINGVEDCTIEGLSLSCSNGVQTVGGLCSQPYIRGSLSAKRTISGSINRQFVNHDFWDKMLAGYEFSLRITAFGQPFIATGSNLDTNLGHAITATPFQYYLDITLHRCRASKAGGNISGPDQIKESVDFLAFLDVAQATEMTIKLFTDNADLTP